jgi:hypothetical protein
MLKEIAEGMIGSSEAIHRLSEIGSQNAANRGLIQDRISDDAYVT